jgi:hypothetical protein
LLTNAGPPDGQHSFEFSSRNGGQVCMPAGKRWDEHILVTVVVLYLNAHPDMLTRDTIIEMTAALTDAFPCQKEAQQ